MGIAAILRRSAGLAFLIVGLSAASARGATPESDNLPVSGVTLFSSGVGQFVHEGIVDGDVEISMAFDTKDINDLLKSLILLDFDGGSVEAVTYPSQDPLDRILGSFSLNIADNPPLHRLLDRARGEQVSLTGAVSVEGTILGVEHRSSVVDTAIIQIPVLNLMSAAGLRQVDLAEIRSIVFRNQELQNELESALKVIAENRQKDKKIISLRFSGDGRRRVRVAYIREVPVWKTSYRLVIDEEGAQLQGWAMVENTGENDWSDVDLTLVSGQPISFVMDLYSPVYVTRPRVTGNYGTSVGPQTYARDIPRAAAPEPSLAQRSYASESLADEFDLDYLGASGSAEPEREKAINLSQGVTSQAGAEGESAFHILRPVSVPRREAALIPIIGARIPAERLSVYDRSVLSDKPLKGVRITNDAGVQLPAGPATIIDAALYGGDARFPAMVDGEDRLLSYAVDLDSSILVESSGEPEEITQIRVIDGVLDATVLQRSITTYRIDRLGDEGMTHLIVHPKRAGWTVEGDVQPASESPRSWRFEIDAPAGELSDLEIIEEYVSHRRFGLSSIRDDQIVFYLNQRSIDSETRRILNRIRELRSDLAEKEEVRRDLESRISGLYREQDRIRRNLEVLEQGSDLYARYIGILNGQEDQIAALNEELLDAKERERDARARLTNYLEDL